MTAFASFTRRVRVLSGSSLSGTPGLSRPGGSDLGFGFSAGTVTASLGTGPVIAAVGGCAAFSSAGQLADVANRARRDREGVGQPALRGLEQPLLGEGGHLVGGQAEPLVSVEGGGFVVPAVLPIMPTHQQQPAPAWQSDK